MLSKRSYVRLFTMVVLLTGSYAGLRADGEVGEPQCYEGTPDHAIQCYSGQVRDTQTQHELCSDVCGACGFDTTVGYAYAYSGGPENGPGCDWILWCACGLLPQ
jgi:hypothetical protein